MQLIHEFMWQAFFGVKDKLVNYKIEYEVEHAGIVKTGSTATESLPNDQTNRNASDVDTDKGEPQTQLTQASTEAIHTEMSQQSNSTAPPVVPSVQESVAKSEDIVQKNKATNTGELTSETHNYGWIGQLQPLPTYDKPLGWVKLNDFLKIMPLSVYCNTVGINRKVDGLDEYYNDPIKIHTAFKDLPDKIRRKLKYKGRYKDAFTEIFNNLMRAGLVMVERPVPGERLQVCSLIDRLNCSSSL
ncbi:general transcription factor 3C polypeptide 1 [Exaiptasia diaphana]|uniref:Uncharacterized protein n=1 Tax=Exaiptasia diaphana TaxID=2652724 RepID=A0A913YIQ2_EXADI|nr:general transcription factor 3C polypeptide 1 [Exaiptasia diaphana]